MTVICQLCQQEIETSHIDLENNIARCSSCRNVFSIDQTQKKAINVKRDKMDLPSCINFQKNENNLQIRRSWRCGQLFYLTPFCIAWDLLFVLWYYNIITVSNFPMLNQYMIVHFVVGIGFTYFCLAQFINTTIISVSDNTLTVKDTPLSFLRNRVINSHDLDQLYSKEKVTRGRSISWSSFEIHAITKAGEHLRLVAGLNKSEQALYIEQTLEYHLGIIDRAVKGEIQR